MDTGTTTTSGRALSTPAAILIATAVITLAMGAAVWWLEYLPERAANRAVERGGQAAIQAAEADLLRARRKDATRAVTSSLPEALGSGYYDACQTYPTTDEGLDALVRWPGSMPLPDWRGPHRGPFSRDEELLTDPWGNPYQYAYPATRSKYPYDLWSMGPDGVDDTEDDITNWAD